MHVLTNGIAEACGNHITDTTTSVCGERGTVWLTDSVCPRGQVYGMSRTVHRRFVPLEMRAWWTWPYGVDVAPPVVEHLDAPVFHLGDYL